MDLFRFGFTQHFFEAHEALFPECEPARVCEQHRGSYVVVAQVGTLRATVAGRLRHASAAQRDLPAVGDWVAIDHTRAGNGCAMIRGVLPRSSAIVRAAAGSAGEEQIIAANVDTMIVVTALDRDFNPRRLERYAALAYGSGVEPVIALNKADCCMDVDGYVAAAESVAPGVAVHAISASKGTGLHALNR